MIKGFLAFLTITILAFAQTDNAATPGTLKWKYRIVPEGNEKYVIGILAMDSEGTVYAPLIDKSEGLRAVLNIGLFLYSFDPNGNFKYDKDTILDNFGLAVGGISTINNIIFRGFGAPELVQSDTNLYFGFLAFIPPDSLLFSYPKDLKDCQLMVIKSPALSSDGSVIFGALDMDSDVSYCCALDRKGNLKWRYKLPDEVMWSPPAISSDGTIYFGTYSGTYNNSFYAITPRGKLKWKHEIDSATINGPASIDYQGNIYFGTTDGKINSLSPSGELRWTYETKNGHAFTPVIGVDGTILFGSGDSLLYALDRMGMLKWTFRTNNEYVSAPAVGSDGSIYFFSDYDHLYAITSSGELKWKYKIESEGYSYYSPMIGPDGTIYFGLYDGYFYAVNSNSRGLANSPWPRYMHDNQNTGRVGGGESVVATYSTSTSIPTTLTPPILSFTVKPNDSDADGVFEGGESVSLTVEITNSGKVKASNVSVSLNGSYDLLNRIGRSKTIAIIEPNQTKSVTFSGFLPYDIQAKNINVNVTLSESQLGKLPQEKVLQIAIAPAKTEVDREVISKLIDVDDVPSRRTTRENTYAVIIGIEQYREDVIPSVDYARTDAEIMREYLINVAGVPSENVFTLYDEQATITDMVYLIEDQLPMAVDEQSMVFIYYSGHGTHDNAGNAYLIPYNGKLASERFLYSLDDLNTALAGLPTENVVVMLDACFSGEGRSAVASGDRPAVMAKLPTSANAKHVTLAAAKADQPAQSYDDVKHGLFTYYLLKGLKGEADTDSDGWVELGELYEFVEENVSKTASRVLFKSQNPTVIPDNLGGKEDMKIGKAR